MGSMTIHPTFTGTFLVSICGSEIIIKSHQVTLHMGVISAMMGIEKTGMSRDYGYSVLERLNFIHSEHWNKMYHGDILNNSHMQ